MYLWQQPDWPAFTWDQAALATLLGQVSRAQGKFLGRMAALGFDLRNEAHLRTLTQDVIKTSEIEGEYLEPDQVRSSIARRLGMDVAGLAPADRNVDGVVDMTLDATSRYEEPLTVERLYGWHSALFPTGRSGMHRISVAAWRDDSSGSMQVVSRQIGASAGALHCAGRSRELPSGPGASPGRGRPGRARWPKRLDPR